MFEQGGRDGSGNTDDERRAAYDGFIHFYNRHHSHGALDWATPTETLSRLPEDNVPADHT